MGFSSVITGLSRILKLWIRFAHLLFYHLQLMHFYVITKYLFLVTVSSIVDFLLWRSHLAFRKHHECYSVHNIKQAWHPELTHFLNRSSCLFFALLLTINVALFSWGLYVHIWAGVLADTCESGKGGICSDHGKYHIYSKMYISAIFSLQNKGVY